jgi:hypothetical protein
MAIVKKSALRVVCAGAFGAAIIAAPVLGASLHPSAGSTTLADVCAQTTTNGSTSVQCGFGGSPGASGFPGFGGNLNSGCLTPYGTYQNCLVQEGLPRASGTGPR